VSQRLSRAIVMEHLLRTTIVNLPFYELVCPKDNAPIVPREAVANFLCWYLLSTAAFSV